MKPLSNDWFIEGLQDFEYKKYVLLAWLQEVSTEFAEVRLYPAFAELINQFNNLNRFKENKQQLYNRFPRRLSSAQEPGAPLQFEPIIEDEPGIQEIEAIVDYALPSIQTHIEDGREIYECFDQQLQIEPIGILPLYRREGYLLLRMEQRREVDAYEYRIVLFENVGVNYHGISLTPLQSFRYGLANSYESIKLQLLKLNPQQPNPATFLIYSPLPAPRESTLLPVAKRKFLAYLK